MARSQIRYIGAGGSPKIDDPSTLTPDHFTVSMVHQPVGKYGASHAHEVEEAFLVIEGVLTVGWEFDGEVILARLGPKDMVLQAKQYCARLPERRRRARAGLHHDGQGAAEPAAIRLSSEDARVPKSPGRSGHDRARRICCPGRAATRAIDCSPSTSCATASRSRSGTRAGFGRLVYIGEGGAPAGSYRKDLVFLPRGAGVRPYQRPVEEAYLVLEGCIIAGWEQNGAVVEQRLGPRDLILNPPGQPHYFRNDGFGDAQFMMIVGEPKPENAIFRAA